MKKLLGIVFLSLLLSGNAYAKKIKPGSGPLKLTDDTVTYFYTYLTEKLDEETFKTRNLPGKHWGFLLSAFGTNCPSKLTYADYFFIIVNDEPYIWQWGCAGGQNPGYYKGLTPQDSKIFARKNKIVWKGAKKKISRKVSLNELKDILRELGLYD